MVISGLLAKTAQGRGEAIAYQLAEIPGLSVHQVVDGYQVVMVLETSTLAEAHRVVSQQIAARDGVMGIYTTCIYDLETDGPEVEPAGEEENNEPDA